MFYNPQLTDSDYPYENDTYNDGTVSKCNIKAKGVVKTTSSCYARVSSTNNGIMTALQGMPATSYIVSSSNLFMYYSGGIITDIVGCGTKADHVVSVVGYGTLGGIAYFIVRNTWSIYWGEQGFVRIGQSPTGGAPGVCGVNNELYQPFVTYA